MEVNCTLNNKPMDNKKFTQGEVKSMLKEAFKWGAIEAGASEEILKHVDVFSEARANNIIEKSLAKTRLLHHKDEFPNRKEWPKDFEDGVLGDDIDGEELLIVRGRSNCGLKEGLQEHRLRRIMEQPIAVSVSPEGEGSLSIKDVAARYGQKVKCMFYDYDDKWKNRTMIVDFTFLRDMKQGAIKDVTTKTS